MTNVIQLDYPSILKQRVLKGEITWQEALNWLQRHGMIAAKAKAALGDPEADTPPPAKEGA